MTALVSAWTLDGKGRGDEIDDLQGCLHVDGKTPLWVHLMRLEADAVEYLDCIPETPPTVQKALFAEDTRPRCDIFNDGVLLNLRAVNRNVGADPTELLTLRVWATENRVISLRRHKVNAAAEIRESIEKGYGPKSVMDFLLVLTETLTEELTDLVETLEDRFELMEEDDDNLDSDAISDLRKEVVAYRRFIDPQLAALTKLANAQLTWLHEGDRNSLRHVVDMVARQREQLEALRERAAILRDTHSSRQAEKMNQTIYFLTIVAGLFLPLSFVTGLLGINVGGIPGAEGGSAFWWVVIGMVVTAVAEIAILKFKKLI